MERNRNENEKKKALRNDILMCLNRIKMTERTLELFSSNTDPELKEFWELTLDNLKYDLDYFMSEYNIPEQE